jgi:uncharacterized protein (TIGR00369 family)
MTTIRWPDLPDDHFLHVAGFRVVESDDATVDAVVEVDVRADLQNGHGALQGGMVASLVDITAGRAVRLRVPPGSSFSTRDLSVHYLAGVTVGPARAVARIRQASRRTYVVQLDVHDAGGGDRLCAVATVTYAVRPPPDEHSL